MEDLKRKMIAHQYSLLSQGYTMSRRHQETMRQLKEISTKQAELDSILSGGSQELSEGL